MEPAEGSTKKRRCVKERVRVTRACDNCKKRKLRCSGTLPCLLCERTRIQCGYTAGYTRGKVPPVPAVGRRAGIEQSAVQHIRQSANSPTDSCSTSSLQDASQRTFSQTDKHALPSSGNSPEPHQTDMEGHYVGPASGVSFLIRVQKRLHEHISFPRATPIFSFGDAPLPKYDSSYLLIPSKDEAKALLGRYFDFAFPTHRFLHQHQVEDWFEDFYNSPAMPQSPKPGAMARRALLLMVFAHGKQCLPKEDSTLGSCVNSAVYFAASEHHLASETGPVRLASVQSRLSQCFYLLGHSRINHCWSLFGTTARLAIAIGLHRGRRRELTSNVDLIEQESRRRVFWCLYSLDNYLSAALGRPRIFHDDEIDQELPAIANDSQISPSGILPPNSSGQSIMLAPVYHAKLSRIISGILRDLYGIRRATLQSQSEAARKYGSALVQWRNELSTFVDLPNVDMLMLTYQRQHTVLNLAFYHAQILLYRPFILKDFKNLAIASSDENDSLAKSVDQNIQHCLDAAMEITNILRDLCERNVMYQSFWFTHYYAFSAIVVLYVHFIQKCSQTNGVETNPTHLEAGEQAQQHLATCGSQSSFAQRYAMVLEELRKEAHKCIQQKRTSAGSRLVTDQQVASNINTRMKAPRRLAPSTGNLNNTSTSLALSTFEDVPAGTGVAPNLPLQLSSIQPQSQDWLEAFMQDSSPGTYVPSMTSWGEFDSLALTGMGELGHLFNPDGIDGYEG